MNNGLTLTNHSKSSSDQLENLATDRSFGSYRLGLSLLLLIPVALLAFVPQPPLTAVLYLFIVIGLCLAGSYHPKYQNTPKLYSVPALLVGAVITFTVSQLPSAYLPTASLFLIWLYGLSRLSVVSCLTIGIVSSTTAYAAAIFWSTERLPLPQLATLDGMNLMFVCSSLMSEKRQLTMARQLRYLSHLSVTDELTALPKRGHLLHSLVSILKSRDASSPPFALMQVTLHDLHHYNQKFGVSAGDRMLKCLSGALMTMTQPPAVLGRFGDRQFLLILPDTNLAMVNMMAHRLKCHMKHHPIQLEEELTSLKFSIGMLSLHHNAIALEELLKKLDQITQLAQANGHQSIAGEDLG